MATLNDEELEFGAFSREEADPMEMALDRASAVKDHPDFAELDSDELRAQYAVVAAASKASSASGAAASLLGSAASSAASLMPSMAPPAVATSFNVKKLPDWMMSLPVEKDPSKWRILEVQIRPDRAWWIIKELLVTVCMGKGLVLTEETACSVLFRKKVAQESVANGMAHTAAYQNVFVRIGVLSSKLRVLHICSLVSGDNKLLGGLVASTRNPLSAEKTKSLVFALDQLLGAIQGMLISQYLTSSQLFMSTPENTSEEGMAANMRDLCIPLEEYAYDQEFSCALLIGLLEPLYKKYSLNLSEDANDASGATTAASLPDALASVVISNGASDDQKQPATSEPSTQSEATSADDSKPARKTSKCYGEVINDMVHQLWSDLTVECDAKVKSKIDEKQKQVTARADAAQRLRVRAITTIMDYPEADVTTLKSPTPKNREDVLLYEGSGVINSVPAKLHVTYGCLIYRTLVPLFATTTIIPFDDIVSVSPTTSYGIHVLAVELNPAVHAKGLTIATGLEVDLLYQLVSELLAMHKRENAVKQLRQQDEREAKFLQTLLDYEEEEKSAEGDDAA
uniref:GRAM domain-containing protein n=1 Tax=Globisporangium ultimum (strain ATCC 200006 / CBS 805.95 / DAOM BR144) TaxID=431595 RepID=K3W790_GLOUD